MKEEDASESVKVTVVVSPAFKESSASFSVMAMVGRMPSIASVLLSLSELDSPGVLRVFELLFAYPEADRIVPLLRARAEVEV